LVVVGGRTGTGKTEILQHLETAKLQVIDLEKLADHKGSAFGGLGMPRQPTNEHFENRIAAQLVRFDLDRVIYIENESRQLGGNKVPDSMYNAIRNAPVIDVQMPEESRLERIVKEYGHFPPEMLAEKTRNLEKRMGPQHVKDALSLLASGNIAAWAEAVMRYYDKTYDYGMSQRPPGMLTPLEGGMESLETIAQKIVLLTPSITDTHTNPIY
jgi:tRNA 2-selenouridine synthase